MADRPPGDDIGGCDVGYGAKRFEIHCRLV